MANSSHETSAEALRRRVLDSGSIGRELRAGALNAGGGRETDLPEPYAALAEQVAGDSYRVTDSAVHALRTAAGSDRAAFEVILSASIGAGLRRWDRAVSVIEEASREAR